MTICNCFIRLCNPHSVPTPLSSVSLLIFLFPSFFSFLSLLLLLLVLPLFLRFLFLFCIVCIFPFFFSSLFYHSSSLLLPPPPSSSLLLPPPPSSSLLLPPPPSSYSILLFAFLPLCYSSSSSSSSSFLLFLLLPGPVIISIRGSVSYPTHILYLPLNWLSPSSRPLDPVHVMSDVIHKQHHWSPFCPFMLFQEASPRFFLAFTFLLHTAAHAWRSLCWTVVLYIRTFRLLGNHITPFNPMISGPFACIRTQSLWDVPLPQALALWAPCNTPFPGV